MYNSAGQMGQSLLHVLGCNPPPSFIPEDLQPEISFLHVVSLMTPEGWARGWTPPGQVPCGELCDADSPHTSGETNQTPKSRLLGCILASTISTINAGEYRFNH